MRTTIDIPDELLRRAKARAAREGVALKDLVATYMEEGLDRRHDPGSLDRRQRSPLPVARPATGKILPLLTSIEIELLMAQEEAASACRNGST